jgi:hypothetical protein
LRAERGCKKPGYNYEERRVFPFTSPMLAPEDRVLRECPVGRVLREAPHAYELIIAHSYSENTGLEILNYPRYLRQAFGVIGSEKERLRELSDKDRQAKADGKYGTAMLQRGGR